MLLFVETKLEFAKVMIREQWKEFQYPNITKMVTDMADKYSFSYSTAWKAYQEVKIIMKASDGGELLTDS